jgi:hypothetical protein
MLEQMRKEAEEAALRSRLANFPPPSPYSDDDLQATPPWLSGRSGRASSGSILDRRSRSMP